MPPKAKKKLITSALPYVNNSPHLGNIIGAVLSADVYARYCRMQGYETLYVCGTDEYGTATETAARKEGVSPKELCDRFHADHKRVYRHFNISFDAFGRTSDPEHIEVVHELFKAAHDRGLMSEATTEQAFCDTCSTFLADRFILGTCPNCQSSNAKGDQCQDCGKLLNPSDLVDPRCATCDNQPVYQPTSHLYLNLDELQPSVEGFFERSSTAGKWTRNAATTTRSWLQAGLKPRPITRDLKWGVPVPLEGFENKVFYVWYDAPIGYVSITKRALPDAWEKWWRSPDDVELYQFMGKDNIPFHSVIFPAVQIASDQPWTMVHHISATEYLNYENGKFSKSENRGVFGTDVIGSPIHVDLWRFYLLSIRPENHDSQFVWQEFFDKVNGDFIDNIGNLLNRVLTYINKQFDGGVVELTSLDARQEGFLTQMQDSGRKVAAALESVQLREALRLVVAHGRAANKFFQDEEPWIRIKTDRSHVSRTISLLIYVLRDVAIMLGPFLPETSNTIAKALNCHATKWQDLGVFSGLEGHQVGQAQILYPKLDSKGLEKIQAQHAGREA